jgi:hypothetical protein
MLRRSSGIDAVDGFHPQASNCLGAVSHEQEAVFWISLNGRLWLSTLINKPSA